LTTTQAKLSHAKQPSVQCLSLAWGTIAPVSRLKTLPPSTTGTSGVGFWRGGCPESKSHRDQQNNAMWGFRPKRFEVSVTYIPRCKYF
jgi:hypothetical protein